MADNVSMKSSSATASATSSRTISIQSDSAEIIPSIEEECMLKLAALVYLRLKKQTNLRFILNAEVKETGLPNVLFLHLEWRDRDGSDHLITYLVALAHIKNDNERKYSSASDGSHEDVLTARESDIEGLDTLIYWQIFKSALEQMNLIDMDEIIGESKRYKKDNNETHFIIYTTDNVTRNTKQAGSTNKDFPFCDLFLTGNHEDIISFDDERDTDGGEDRATGFYYTFFLPRLKIFAKQRGPMGLDALIKPALASADKNLVLDSGEFLLAYLDWMKQWRVEDKYCLTENSCVLETAIIKKMMEDDHPQDIGFHESEYEAIINMLNTVDIFYITVPDIPKQLRSCKVVRALQRMHKNSFVLSGRILSTYPLSTISVLCRACDAIVINSDLTVESIQLLNTISTESLKNIVVISTNFLEPLCEALLCLHRTYEEWTEMWTLSELENSQQERLMDSVVNFQGRHVSLRDLESVWPKLRYEIDGPMLTSLLSGSVAIVGDVPAPYIVLDPHISRLICHRSRIKPEVFELNTDRDIIMVTEIPKKLLDDILNQAGHKDESETNSLKVSSLINSMDLTEYSSVESLAGVIASGGVDIGYSRRYKGDLTWINPPPVDLNKKLVIYSYAESSVLCAFQQDITYFTQLAMDYEGKKNVHWISYEDGILTWKNTLGDDKYILPYLDKMGPDCLNAPICVHNDFYFGYYTWKSKVLTLLGGKAMGKTTTMKKIASELREELKTYWIIEIPLLKFKLHLETSFRSEEINLSEIVDFLYSVVNADNSTSPRFCRNFLKHSVEEFGNCVILVDGLDDLEDAQKKIALRLITRLSETNVDKIWVSLSKKEELNLNESLRSHPLELQAIDPDDQEEYLSNRWGLGNENDKPKKMSAPLSKMPFCDGTELFTVPLYLLLFSDTYVPPRHKFDLTTYIEGLQDDLPRCNVFHLYRDFVKKFELGERNRHEAATPARAGPKKSKRKKSAAKADQPPTPAGDQSESAFSARSERIANYLTGGREQEAHRSITDYFVALWLKANHATLGKEYLRKNLLPTNKNYCVRSQVDWLLGEGLRLHEVAVSGEDVGEMDVVWDGGRLHARDLVGRQALHLAVMYEREDLVFQLLQAGAAVDVKDEVLGWTPMDYADASLNLGIIEMLLQHGGDPERLKTLRERSEQEKLDLMVKRAFVVHEKKAECLNNSLVFVAPISVADLDKLGLQEDLVNNKDNSFNEDTVFHTLELPHPYVFPLLQIAYNGYSLLAKHLLGKNCVDDPCLFSVSALHVAAHYKHDSIVKLLLDHGLPCNQRKHDGQTPLHVACKVSQNLYAVKALLAAGANVNSPDNFWMTPAMLAASHGHSELLSELLKHDIHLESADQRGRTALFHAVQENKMNAVKVLLEAGANVYAADKFAIHPMQVAIAKGFSEMVLEMFQYADITKHRDLFGATPLHLACAYQQLDLFIKLLVKKHLVNVTDSDGVTPLHIAAKLGNSKFVDILLKRGANGHSEDANGLNALHYATMGGNEAIIKKMIKMGIEDTLSESKYEKCLVLTAMLGKVEAMKYFLRRGAVIDPANPNHCALLHYGIVSKNFKMIWMLLDIGIHINAQEPSANNVPLHIAVQGGDLKTVEMLLEKGANPNMMTDDWRTPLHVAAIYGHQSITKVLLNHGGDPNVVDRFTCTPLILAMRFKHNGVLKVLVEAGANTENSLIDSGWSVLHVAVVEADTNATKYLVNKGVDVNILDARNITPLLLACGGNAEFELIQFLINQGSDLTVIDNKFKRNALHSAAYRGKTKVVRLLIELGVNMEIGDRWGNTPLHLAASMGQIKCVRLLVSKGAILNSINTAGVTPLHMAFRNKRKYTVNALLDLGADLRYVKFDELNIWDGVVTKPDYMREIEKFLRATEQRNWLSPLKLVSASTLRRKKKRFSPWIVPQKRKNLFERITKERLDVYGTAAYVKRSNQHNLLPLEVKPYLPLNADLKWDSRDQMFLEVSPPQRSSRSLKTLSKTVHPQSGITPKKSQDCLQAGSTHAPPAEPLVHTPPVPVKHTSMRISAKRTPVPIPAKSPFQSGPSKHSSPEAKGSKGTLLDAKASPSQVRSQNFPKQKLSKKDTKQEEACNVSQKERSKLAHQTTSQCVNNKTSNNVKSKKGFTTQTENGQLKESPENGSTKYESRSKSQRRSRRR